MSGRVAVALSGGVDSLVSAILLRRGGARLVGVYMRNWEERDEGNGGHCTAEAEFARVREICAALQIPCTRADFVKEYWNDVFSRFLEAYERGHTPNPDIMCNRHIKFSALHHYCRGHLEVDTIATGHYARVEKSGTGKVRLKTAVDSSKDQTYFLSQVPQSCLASSLFPVGHLTKEEVKQIATEAGFEHIARQKESMGLCFIGKRDFAQFISEYIEERVGRFVTLEGKEIGWHRGHHLFTVGQRACIGGKPHPFFVAGKDPVKNIVTVVDGADHPALFTLSFTTSHPHWISDDPLMRGAHSSFRCELRHRHQGPLVEVEVKKGSEGNGLCVVSDVPLKAVAPGQYAVFYRQDECLGGACIMTTDPINNCH